MLSYLARLILFMIAVSVIRSVVNRVRRLWYGQQQPRPRQPFVRPPAPQQPASTVLRQDPVCGTYVAVDSSLKKVIRGEVFHFCSPECRNRYNA